MSVGVRGSRRGAGEIEVLAFVLFIILYSDAQNS